jgi:hypothetical protein
MFQVIYKTVYYIAAYFQICIPIIYWHKVSQSSGICAGQSGTETGLSLSS